MFALSGWVNNKFPGLLNARPATPPAGAVDASINMLAASPAGPVTALPPPLQTFPSPATVSHQLPPSQPNPYNSAPHGQGGFGRPRYGVMETDSEPMTTHQHSLQPAAQPSSVPSQFFNKHASREARQVQLHQNHQIQSRLHAASPNPLPASNTSGMNDLQTASFANQAANGSYDSRQAGHKRAADNDDPTREGQARYQSFGPGAPLDGSNTDGDMTAAGQSMPPSKRRAIQPASPSLPPATAWWAPKAHVRDFSTALNTPATPLAIISSAPATPATQPASGSRIDTQAGAMVLVAGSSAVGGAVGMAGAGSSVAAAQGRSMTPDMRTQLRSQVWQRDQNRALNFIQSQKRSMPGSPHGGVKKWAPPLKRRYSAVPQMNDEHDEFEEGNGGPLCKEAQSAATRPTTVPSFAFNPLVPSSQSSSGSLTLGASGVAGSNPTSQPSTAPSTTGPAATAGSAASPGPVFSFFGGAVPAASTQPSGAAAGTLPSTSTTGTVSPAITPSSTAASGGFLDRLLASGTTLGSTSSAAGALASTLPVSSLTTVALSGSTSASALLTGLGGVAAVTPTAGGSGTTTAPTTPSFNFGAPATPAATAGTSATPSGLPIFNFGAPPAASTATAPAFSSFNLASTTTPTAPASPRNTAAAPTAGFPFASSLPSSTPSMPNFFPSAAAAPPSNINPFLSTPATTPTAAAPAFGSFGTFGATPAAPVTAPASGPPSFAFGGGGFGTQQAAPGLGSFGGQPQPAAAVGGFGSFPAASTPAFSFGAGGPSSVSPALMTAANTPLPSQQQPSFFGAAQQPPPTPNFGFNAAPPPSFGSPFPAAFPGQSPAAAGPSFGGQQQGMFGGQQQQQQLNFGAGPPAAAPDPGGGFNVGAGAANAGQRRVVAARRAGRR